MEKPDFKTLKGYVRQLNKSGYLEEKIDKKLELDNLIEKFILGMMRIDDLGKSEEFPNEMIEFQNTCCEYRAYIKNDSQSDGDFDRDDLEEKLEKLNFDDLEEYADDNDIDIDMDEDDFSEKQDDWIEEILDVMEEKSKKDSSSLEKDDLSNYSNLLAKLKAMDFKELKAYIKADPKLKEEFGLLKKDAFLSKDYPTDIVKFISQSNDSKKEDFGIREKLFKMDYKEVKAFIKENSLDLKVKSKNWKDQKTKSDIVLEIAKLLDKKPSEKKVVSKEELEGMDYDEIMAFIKENNLSEDIDPEDYEEDDFDDEKSDIINEILEVMGKATPKKDSPKKATSEKKPKKSNLRKEGDTYQEVAAIILKESNKPLTKESIVRQVLSKKDDANEKSAKNFTSVMLQVAIALDVAEYDSANDTYKMK